MSIIPAIHKSDMGTVRFFGDKFFDNNYNVVYVPLTESVAMAFVELVNVYENRVGRRLCKAEIDQCARLAEKSK